MESASIIKAVVAQWRGSTAVLESIPIRSTRIPAGPNVVFPYCLVQAEVLYHKFCSGTYRLTMYKVTLTVYCGNDKGVLNSIGTAITELFDLNIGLPVLDNCYVLSVLPLQEDPDKDPDDYYGADCNVLRQAFRVLLNETTNPVQSVLAT